MTSITRTGLRNKALLIGILPAILMSILIGGYLISARLGDLEQALQSRGEALANELAAISIYGLFSGDTEVLDRSAQRFLARPDVVSVSIFSHNRKLVLQLKNSHLGEDYGPESGNHVYVFETIVRGIPARDPLQSYGTGSESPDSQTSPLGQVKVELADRTLISLRQEILFTAALLIIGGIILTGLLTLLMSRQVVQPILALSDAMNRLKQGDLSARVRPRAKDEIGVLEDGFNEMAARVALTQDELMAEVDQAVDDLKTTMDALEVRNIQLDLERKKALTASQAKSDFLALISHEIRTPMNGIIGFSRLLQKSELTPDQTEQIKAIQDSADNLLSIINDVLDFAKLESGRISFHPGAFRLRQQINGVIALFTHQARDRGIDLMQMVYDDVPDHLFCDSLRVRQVLINLLSNALKFTKEGTITVRVMLDGPDNDEHLTFSVQDTGIGIAPELGPKLFHPFTQADASTERQYGGTGLGLSISKKLVEGMRGSIDFTSIPGSGSTFRFSLPLQVATDEDRMRALAQEKSCISSIQGKDFDLSDLQILVADDNRINLELAQALLHMHGASVVTVENGEEAVARAGERKFDLILIDVHMPVMNGLEAARRIRGGTGPNSDTPIVAITADVMAENQKQIFNAGINQTLLKPIDEHKLLETIKSFSLVIDQPDTSTHATTVTAASTEDDFENLPIRDHETALRAAAGNQELADEIFGMLITQLDRSLPEIIEHHHRKEWNLMWNQAHKLLGASAACGVPALHAILQQMDAAVARNDEKATPRLIAELEAAAAQLRKVVGPG